MSAYNPSQDLRMLVERLYLWGEKTVIAVAPAFEQQQQHRSPSASPSSPPDQTSLSGDFSGRRKGPENEQRGDGSRHSGNGDEAIGAGSESVAAEEFSSWLVDQLGGAGR